MLNYILVESARRLVLMYTEDQLLAHPALAIAGGWVFAAWPGARGGGSLEATDGGA